MTASVGDRIPTLTDLGDVRGKRVLVRTDFNVPMDGGVITDDFRIRAALPTINWLTERGAQVVCASHLGRPKGKPEPKYSMDAVRARLAELAPGVELLENLRFAASLTGRSPADALDAVGLAGLADLPARVLSELSQPLWQRWQACG